MTESAVPLLSVFYVSHSLLLPVIIIIVRAEGIATLIYEVFDSVGNLSCSTVIGVGKLQKIE